MERLGIYGSWRTERSIAKFADLHFANGENRWEADRQRLESYTRGENLFLDSSGELAKPPYFFYIAASFSCARRDHTLAIRRLFGRAGDWKPPLKKAYAYHYWRKRLEHRVKKSAMGRSFNFAVEALYGCLYFGWMDQAKSLTDEICNIYGERRFGGVTGIFGQPLYHWFLRICFDYYGFEFDGWGKGFHGEAKDIYAPPECFSEPVLNELFEHWRDEDLAPMHDHLIWLCDYYTHRTRTADGTEFGNDLLHTRFPALILAWFRLREQLGLPIPEIDHPLMQPTYARLPPPEPFYTDELLEGVLARLRREEIPDLGEVHKDSEPEPEPPKKVGWLRQLLGQKSP
jgi:hypothetical protein